MQQEQFSDRDPARLRAPVQHSAHPASTAAETLLAELMTEARAAGLAFCTHDWTAAAFRHVFANWLSAFTYTRVDAADPSAAFPVIWLLARHDPRRDTPKRVHALFAVALNPATHQFQPINGRGRGTTAPDLAADHRKLCEFVAAIAASKTFLRLHVNPSMQMIRSAISRMHARFMQTADDLLDLFAEGAQLRAPTHIALVPFARAVMLRHLTLLRGTLDADLARTIDRDVFRWTEILRHPKLTATPLAIYNHVMASPTATAVRHRMAAIDILSGSYRLHLDNTELWISVDLGKPPQVVLAPLFGIRPSTLRTALKRWPKTNSWRYISQFLNRLDALDPDQWPVTEDDLFAFQYAIRIAEPFGRMFGREPRMVIRSWKKQAARTPWFTLIISKLAPQIEAGRQQARRQGFDRMWQSQRTVMEPAAVQFVTDVEGVAHMRADISRRLIGAAVRLEAERLGATANDIEDAAHLVARPLADRLWQQAAPTEQMQISARWHAAHRTWRPSQSAAVSDTTPTTPWATLIAEPLTLRCGVVVHPLDTAAKLAEEGADMNHCVGSMAPQCRRGQLHIFGLRSVDGTRLSTLSVGDDAISGHDRRRIALHQNLAVRNSAPPTAAVRAAREFIDRINGNASSPGWSPIAVDWAAIDDSRATAASLQPRVPDEHGCGFDFRDLQARETMVRLIWPCLPRHLKSRARTIAGGPDVTFEDLAAAAGVPEAMASWGVSREREFRSASRVALRLRAAPGGSAWPFG